MDPEQIKQWLQDQNITSERLKAMFESHESVFTINIPKDCLKPVGVVYNNDDGTAIVVMHNSIEEALSTQIP